LKGDKKTLKCFAEVELRRMEEMKKEYPNSKFTDKNEGRLVNTNL